MLNFRYLLRAFGESNVGRDRESLRPNWSGNVIELELRVQEVAMEEIYERQHQYR